jgi:hypothetical protein
MLSESERRVAVDLITRMGDEIARHHCQFQSADGFHGIEVPPGAPSVMLGQDFIQELRRNLGL